MSLQNSTIQRYRLFYPQETLREISARTGIQITRVFRLINGKPMRLQEFEAFETAIQNKLAENPHQARLNKNIEEAFSILCHEDLAKVADYIERKVNNRKFARGFTGNVFEEAGIA